MINDFPKANLIDISQRFTDIPEKKEEWTKIVNFVCKKSGEIRRTKPKVVKEIPETGKAAYVWRMVVFVVSPKHQHQCQPTAADFDLPAHNQETGEWSCQLAREMAKELDVLIDIIVNSVSKSEWHGANRWAKAFGIY